MAGSSLLWARAAASISELALTTAQQLHDLAGTRTVGVGLPPAWIGTPLPIAAVGGTAWSIGIRWLHPG